MANPRSHRFIEAEIVNFDFYPSREKSYASIRAFRGSRIFGAVSCVVFVLSVAACSGGDATPVIGGDSGIDDRSSSSSSVGSGSGSGGGGGSGATRDGGSDSTTGGDSAMIGDSTMSDATGGDSTTTQDAADASGGDATMVTDAGDGGANDSGTGGDGSDASASCGADNTACVHNGSQGRCKGPRGLCVAGACM